MKKVEGVILGGRELKLGMPRYALAASIATFMGGTTNEAAGAAACLGICWEAGEEPRPPAQFRRCKSETIPYGEAVLEELHRRGIDFRDVIKAGRSCFAAMADVLIPDTEVAGAEGNSEAPEGGAA